VKSVDEKINQLIEYVTNKTTEANHLTC